MAMRIMVLLDSAQSLYGPEGAVPGADFAREKWL